MAFQQPQRHPIPRHSSLNAPATALQPVVTPQSATREPIIEQSQEWVLFSKEQAHTDETLSTHTPRTIGRAQYSEIGSLETAAVSERGGDVDHATDTEDLDSLDDGLGEFHQEQKQSNIAALDLTQTVLPQHDGMGMFPGSSATVQEQHWQHEKHNPRRRRLSARRSSIQRRADILEQQDEPRNADEERTQRIEKWRLDQSRAVLDEIERETRRLRRRNRLSDSRASQASLDPSVTNDAAADGDYESKMPEPASESLWERFKRRVIKEFMGIDDATLSFIFGEALPLVGVEDEVRLQRQNILEQVNQVDANDEYALARASDQWEDKLLARIARELGILMQQFIEHPGAFSSYLRTQEPLPYAGLATPKASSLNLPSEARKAAIQPPNAPHFSPTLAHQRQTRTARPHHRRSKTSESASLWGIEEEDDTIESAAAYRLESEDQKLKQECDYWERDLDIKMVFGYLRSRLSSSSPFSSPPKESSGSAPPNPAAALVSSAASHYTQPAQTHTQSDSLRRAALIRHQHPLINRNNSSSLNPSSARGLHPHRRASSALSAPLSPILGRRDSSSLMDDGVAISSCASQSTKKSKTAHSGSLGGGSSRNFWDIGADSVGSSGPAWTTGWGEA